MSAWTAVRGSDRAEPVRMFVAHGGIRGQFIEGQIQPEFQVLGAAGLGDLRQACRRVAIADDRIESIEVPSDEYVTTRRRLERRCDQQLESSSAILACSADVTERVYLILIAICWAT